MMQALAVVGLANRVSPGILTPNAPAPHVLWAWPDSEECDSINYFAQFCWAFPPVPPKNPTQFWSKDQEFVFSVSSEKNASERLLCCCILVASREGDHSKVSFVQRAIEHGNNSFSLVLKPEKLEPEKDVVRSPAGKGHRRSYSTGTTVRDGFVELSWAPRCFCIITRYPFVLPTFVVLRALVECDRKQAGDPVKILKDFKVPVPSVGDALALPGGLSFTRSREAAIQEERHLHSWCVSRALQCLCSRGDTKFLAKLICATMLERSIVLQSESLESLTSVGFALCLAFVRPFVYQSVFLPLLPPALAELLQSPVPFVVGMHSSNQDAIAEQARGAENHVLMVNLDSQLITDCSGKPIKLPAIPLADTLVKDEVNPLLQLFLKSNVMEDREILSVQIAGAWTRFWEQMFANFQRHCFRDLTNPDDPISIFMPDAFIEEMEHKGAGSSSKEFFSSFFATQMWQAHSDEKRTRFDMQRRNSILSHRMIQDFRAQRTLL